MSEIINLIKQIGPIRSSELREKIGDPNLSEDAAKKRISRLSDPVKKLYPKVLPNNENIIYHKDEWGTEDFFTKLAEIVEKSHSSHANIIKALKTRKGGGTLLQIESISGLPTKPVKKKITFESALEKLVELRLVTQIEESFGTLLVLSGQEPKIDPLRAVYETENILLEFVKQWCKKLGFSSFDQTKIRTDDETIFAQYAWDLVGPSYISPLTDFRQEEVQHGFFVGDIILNEIRGPNDINGFIKKVDAIKYHKRNRPFVPLLICQNLDTESLEILRKKGVLIGLINNLFGEEILQAVRNLTSILENLSGNLVKDHERVFNTLKVFSKLEGASLNLRSIIIELIVGRLYSLQGYNIDMRQIVKANGEKAEIDVKAVRNDEAVCIECKGMLPGNKVTKEIIEDWVENSMPTINSWLKRADSLPVTQSYRFYSSTGYSDTAKKYINQLEAKYKKRPIRFFEYNDIVGDLRSFNETALVNTLREQFYNPSY